VLQRRSAVALDGVSSTDRASFLQMLASVLPGAAVPWTALWWRPRIHLAIFVHRVTGLAPGLYLLLREHTALPHLQAAFDPRFAWTMADEHFPLYLLEAGSVRSRAQRLSCDQAIAADGFFSLGMIADFERSLTEHGASFYRQLFWESGVIGQALYLAAEAAGARGTGIGCFYDDPVHDTLGLKGHAFQSLYHFTIGMPVEDRRLTTEPGYDWER
jgi:nitroreductase